MMRCLAVMTWITATVLGAQEPVPPTPAPPADSTRVESLPPPPPPSPEQKRFLLGLRTASRGIAQILDGVSRVTRAQSTHDAVSQRRAGRFLAGLCGSGRAFLKRGRPQMSPTVYEDTVRLKARRLVTQIDSLIAYTPTCEDSAAATPAATVVELGKRMKTYDAARRDFLLAVGLPVREDSSKQEKRLR
ncbi:MAG TPA: hypothetical protein VGV12_07270 [Gemmatimonadales bacterium]|nr:hypothetical protein [Gemmatimonadales bacterium]